MFIPRKHCQHRVVGPLFLNTIVSLSIFLFAKSVSFGDDSGKPSSPSAKVVTELREFNQLRQSRDPVSFRFRGRLIWMSRSQNSRHRFIRLQIQEGTKAFTVDLGKPNSQKILSSLSIGDLLEVSGRDKPASSLRAKTLRKLEDGSPKDLKKVTAFKNSQAASWRYVEHTGYVTEVLQVPNGFRLLFGKSDLIVMSHQNVPQEQLKSWLGARLRVEGSSMRLNGRLTNPSQLLHVGVLDADLQIEVLDPANLQGSTDSPAELKLQDALIQHAGQNFILVDGHRIRTSMSTHLRVGNVVNLRAQQHSSDQKYDARWISKIRNINVPAPAIVTVQQIIDTNGIDRRVSLLGTIESCFASDTTLELSLKSDGNLVLAKMPVPRERRQIDQFTQNSVAKITGLVSRFTPKEKTVIELDVSSSDDVVIAEHPLQFQPHQVHWVLSAAVITALFLAAWYYLLKRQVRHKTKALSTSTSRMIAASEAVRDGMLIFDGENYVRLASNKVTETLNIEVPLGVSEETACRMLHVSVKESQEFIDIWKATFADPQAIVEQEFELRSGGCAFVFSAPILDAKQRPDGRIWTFEDITQRRKLENETLQHRKMSAVGQLAGGLAHDFSNLLQVIGLNLKLLQDESIQAYINEPYCPLEEVSSAVDRGAQLTRQLLTYARASDVHRVATDINQLIKRTTAMLERTFGEHIQLVLDLHEELPQAEVDAGQIEQVLINLCLNARDAIGRTSGQILVSTQNEPNWQPTPAISIIIQDTGCGIPADMLERIFEPFYTTKEADQGTGLGLSTSLGVIRKLGGEITCRSELGIGTEFKISIPSCLKPQRPLSSLTTNQFPKNLGSLKILLVDDDAQVRRSIRNLLVGLEHQAIAVGTGEDALQKLKHSTFDVLLLDLSMPRMTGWQLLEKVRQLYPDQKVIVCSGYSSEADKAMTSDLEPDAFLNKPFQVSDLNQAFASVLSPVEA